MRDEKKNTGNVAHQLFCLLLGRIKIAPTVRGNFIEFLNVGIDYVEVCKYKKIFTTCSSTLQR